jgi:hypothetical protein
MNRSRLSLPAVLAALTLAVGSAGAQEIPALVVEMRGGAALPVSSFRTGADQSGEIARAPSFGLHFVYRSSAGWGPYVGFSQHRFDCGADGCPGAEYVATMWDLGAQRVLGDYAWLRAGLLFGRMERDFLVGVPDEAGATARRRRTSSLGLGLEGGAGLRVPIGGRMALTPGVRYGWLNTRFKDAALMEMRWVSADLGLAIVF